MWAPNLNGLAFNPYPLTFKTHSKMSNLTAVADLMVFKTEPTNLQKLLPAYFQEMGKAGTLRAWARIIDFAKRIDMRPTFVYQVLSKTRTMSTTYDPPYIWRNCPAGRRFGFGLKQFTAVVNGYVYGSRITGLPTWVRICFVDGANECHLIELQIRQNKPC